MNFRFFFWTFILLLNQVFVYKLCAICKYHKFFQLKFILLVVKLVFFSTFILKSMWISCIIQSKEHTQEKHYQLFQFFWKNRAFIRHKHDEFWEWRLGFWTMQSSCKTVRAGHIYSVCWYLYGPQNRFVNELIYNMI